MLRILAEIGPQAEWVLVFLAVIIGVFVLLFAIATLVGDLHVRCRAAEDMLRDLPRPARVLPPREQQVSARNGVGRPPCCPRELVVRIYRLHYEDGVSYEKIAELLNAKIVPMRGG